MHVGRHTPRQRRRGAAAAMPLAPGAPHRLFRTEEASQVKEVVLSPTSALKSTSSFLFFSKRVFIVKQSSLSSLDLNMIKEKEFKKDFMCPPSLVHGRLSSSVHVCVCVCPLGVIALRYKSAGCVSVGLQ